MYIKIKNYEIGFIKPFGWYGFDKIVSSCKCTHWYMGPLFMTKLHKECINEM